VLHHGEPSVAPLLEVEMARGAAHSGVGRLKSRNQEREGRGALGRAPRSKRYATRALACPTNSLAGAGRPVKAPEAGAASCRIGLLNGFDPSAVSTPVRGTGRGLRDDGNARLLPRRGQGWSILILKMGA
jgi:hypothetical protein